MGSENIAIGHRLSALPLSQYLPETQLDLPSLLKISIRRKFPGPIRGLDTIMYVTGAGNGFPWLDLVCRHQAVWQFDPRVIVTIATVYAGSAIFAKSVKLPRQENGRREDYIFRKPEKARSGPASRARNREPNH
jgi:hypothetical protein